MLPQRYSIAVINRSGAVIDVTVAGKAHTLQNNSDVLNPLYDASETIWVQNAALADQGDAESSVIVNTDRIGLRGQLTVTPAASANGTVEAKLLTYDAAGTAKTDIDNSPTIATLEFVSSAVKQTASLSAGF